MSSKKEELVGEIAILLGFPKPNMSNGSREPKTLFSEALVRLGISEKELSTKILICEHIATIAGLTWTPDCWSRGGTVTYKGLEVFRDAISILLDT